MEKKTDPSNQKKILFIANEAVFSRHSAICGCGCNKTTVITEKKNPNPRLYFCERRVALTHCEKRKPFFFSD